MLGRDFLGVLQTKSIDCLMETYWLSVDGCLYLVDMSSNYKDDMICDISPQLDPARGGARGRLRPCDFSGVARFTALRSPDMLEASVYFKEGRLELVISMESSLPGRPMPDNVL
jgi:hypothetical protein